MCFRRRSLRSLRQRERAYLEQVTRSQDEATGRIVRAFVLLALANGRTPAEAARESKGLLSEEEVHSLVARFKREGVNALNFSSEPPIQPDPLRIFRELPHRLSQFFKRLVPGNTQPGVLRQTATRSWSLSPIIAQLNSLVSTSTARIKYWAASFSSFLVGVTRNALPFFKTKQGGLLLALLIAVVSFGIWRVSLPDPFDAGYIALKPVDRPQQPNLEAEPVEAPLPSSQFVRPIPKLIPTVEASKLDSSGMHDLKIRNVSRVPITVSLVHSQSGKSYFISLQKDEVKTVFLPSGTHQIHPSKKEGDTIITIPDVPEYCIYNQLDESIKERLCGF